RSPAAVHVELDPLVLGSRCSLAERTEEVRIEAGHGRDVVLECRRAGRRWWRRQRPAHDDSHECCDEHCEGNDDRWSCSAAHRQWWFALEHAPSQGSTALSARMCFSICRRYASAL